MTAADHLVQYQPLRRQYRLQIIFAAPAPRFRQEAGQCRVAQPSRWDEGFLQQEAHRLALLLRRHHGPNRSGIALAMDALGVSTDQRYHMMHEVVRSEEHTSELQSLMRNSYAVFCLKKKT